MKRFFFFLPVLITLFAITTNAENTTLSPEQEEKIKRLGSDVETLIAANAELQKKISMLTEELARVREEQARAANSSSVDGVREDLRRLAEKIQEVDKKRIEDNKGIAAELENIEKSVRKAAEKAASQPRPPRDITPETPVATDKPGLNYVVKEGDTLSEIIQAANAQLKERGMKKVTLQQVLDANPGLKPTTMRIGQKIFIPGEK